MLLRARRIWGFWPVIFARSSTAPSSARLLTTASPTPMLTTIFSRPGILIGFWISNRSFRAGAISSRYLSFSLAIDVPPGLLGDPDLLPRVREPVPDLGRLPAAGVHQHHVRDVYGGVEGEEPLLVVLARPRVSRPRVYVVHHHAVLLRDDPLDLAALALVLAGDHNDRVPALYLETHRLEYLRGQRDDPRVALVPELARHRPEDAGTPRGPVLVDDDAGVLAEADVRPVVPARLLLGPHHDGPHDLALLDGAARRRLLDRGDDDVAHTGIAPLAAAEDPDRQDASGARVVGDPQSGFLLDHYSALDTTLASRQRLRAEMGRVSMILTVSPTRASLPSSWTINFLDRRTRFLYLG